MRQPLQEGGLEAWNPVRALLQSWLTSLTPLFYLDVFTLVTVIVLVVCMFVYHMHAWCPQRSAVSDPSGLESYIIPAAMKVLGVESGSFVTTTASNC